MPSMLGPVELGKFSPWLQNFHWLLTDECIELPGQYTGESRPDIKTTIKIVRLDAKVTVFATIRRPMKISILCSDGNTYDFLVKCGEDLRQDQGIQQIQRLIADHLAVDKNCRSHNLGIETFKVIPINPFCGMLSWVEDTQSMDHLFGDIGLDAVKRNYRKFLEKAPAIGSKTNTSLYGDAAAYYSPKAVSKSIISANTIDDLDFWLNLQIAENYAALSSTIPADVLRNALYTMSSTPECFFMLRNNFVTSLATMGICNWILGIGDRHLRNLLFSKKTGKIVGIDFGHAYGSATRELNIPEMIPMRMTPQFVKVIGPMETSGLIKKSMVYTLRAIRTARKTIMATIVGFMTNQSTTVKLNDERDTGSDRTSTDSQNPKQRIKVVNKKLLGANPIQLIANDLRCGLISKYAKSSYCFPFNG